MNAPCLKCEHRQLGCHSICPGYLEFVSVKSSERDRRAKENDINDYVKNQVNLNKKETMRTPKKWSRTYE